MLYELPLEIILSKHIRIYCNIEKLSNKKNQKYPVIILIRNRFHDLLY